MKPIVVASLFLLLLAFGGCAASGIYHPVQSGESLEEIAARYKRDKVLLARINGLDGTVPLRPGSRLYIPGAGTLLHASESPPLPAPVTSPPAAKPSRLASAPAVMPQKSVSRSDQPPPAAKPGLFHWPLRGPVLRRFGDREPFPSKGVEIGASPRTPVLAAAAGRVIYSGDGIRGYGPMLILRHDNDFYTVYAYNERLLVDVGRFVSRGEKVALSGTAPEGGASRLYFEIRRHKEPVDPFFYLP